MDGELSDVPFLVKIDKVIPGENEVVAVVVVVEVEVKIFSAEVSCCDVFGRAGVVEGDGEVDAEVKFDCCCCDVCAGVVPLIGGDSDIVALSFLVPLIEERAVGKPFSSRTPRTTSLIA
jgi:hypothetical protein